MTNRQKMDFIDPEEQLNADGENILSDHLGQLGNLKLHKQLDVNTESVEKLSKTWDIFKELLDNKRISSIHDSFHSLLRYTGYIIFDYKFESTIDQTTRLLLVNSVQSTSYSLSEFSTLHKMCISLDSVLKEPWTVATFKGLNQARTIKELSIKAIDDVWATEGWLLLEIRMEIMGRSKKLPLKDLMVKILHVCVMQGNKWFKSDYSESVPDDWKFDPYRYSYDQYLEYLEIYVLFWHKFRDLVDSSDLKTLPPKLMSEVIKRLRVKALANESGRILSRLWKFNSKTMCFPLVHELVPAVFERIYKSEDVRLLLEQMVELFLESTEETDQIDKMQEILQAILLKRDEICLTDYIYELGEVIIHKFGMNEKTRIMYADTYLRAMMVDLNFIENLRAQLPLTTEKLSTENIRLSNRLLVMANFFKHCPTTFRDLQLTAFSLNPSKTLFDKLFSDLNSKTVSSVCIKDVVDDDTLVFNKESVSHVVEATLNNETTSIVEENMESEGTQNVSVMGDEILHGTEETTPLENESSEQPPEKESSEQPPENECVPEEFEKEKNSQTEDLQLPAELLDDLDTIIIKPRWGALGHFTKGDELRKLCLKLLVEGHEWLIKEQSLNYINVDFEKYKHLPSKYDPNDDGIEKGFFLPRKRGGIRRNFRVIRGVKGKKLVRRPLGRPKGALGGTKKNGNGGGLNPSKGKLGRPGKINTLQKAELVNKKIKKGSDLNIEKNLHKIRQFVCQDDQLKEVLSQQSKSVKVYQLKVKGKKMKENYSKKFSKESEPLPPDFNIVLTPKTYGLQEKIGGGKNKLPPRKPATVYLCPDTPHRLRLQGVHDCELEFRFERRKLLKGFNTKTEQLTTIKSENVQFPKTVVEKNAPKSTDQQWEEVGDTRSIDLSAECSIQAAPNTKPGVVLITDSLSIPPDLVEITKNYFKKKEEAKEERQRQQLLINEQQQNKSNSSHDRRRSWKYIYKEPTIKTGESNENEVHFNLFTLGEIWEYDVSRKTIVPPIGPKKKQEEFKRKAMINDAFIRMENNLNMRSYNWDIVHANELIDPEESTKPVFGPLTKEEHDKLLETTGSKATFPTGSVLKLQSSNGFAIPLNKSKQTAEVSIFGKGLPTEFKASNNAQFPGPLPPRKRGRKSKRPDEMSTTSVTNSSGDSSMDGSKGGEASLAKPTVRKYGKTYKNRRSSKGDTESEGSSYSTKDEDSGSAPVKRRWIKLDDKVFEDAKAAVESGQSVVEVACLFGYIPNTLRKKLQKAAATCSASRLPPTPSTNTDLKQDTKMKAKNDESVVEKPSEASDSTLPILPMVNDDNNSPQENPEETDNRSSEEESLEVPIQTNSVRISFPQLQSPFVRKVWELKGGKPTALVVPTRILCEKTGKFVLRGDEISAVEYPTNDASWSDEETSQSTPASQVETPNDDAFWKEICENLDISNLEIANLDVSKPCTNTKPIERRCFVRLVRLSKEVLANCYSKQRTKSTTSVAGEDSSSGASSSGAEAESSFGTVAGGEVKRSNRIRSKNVRLDFSKNSINKITVDSSASLTNELPQPPLLAHEKNGIVPQKKTIKRKREKDGPAETNITENNETGKKSKIEKENVLPNVLEEEKKLPTTTEKKLNEEGQSVNLQSPTNCKSVARKRTRQRSETFRKKKPKPAKRRKPISRRNRYHSQGTTDSETESSNTTDSDCDYIPTDDELSECSDTEQTKKPLVFINYSQETGVPVGSNSTVCDRVPIISTKPVVSIRNNITGKTEPVNHFNKVPDRQLIGSNNQQHPVKVRNQPSKYISPYPSDRQQTHPPKNMTMPDPLAFDKKVKAVRRPNDEVVEVVDICDSTDESEGYEEVLSELSSYDQPRNNGIKRFSSKSSKNKNMIRVSNFKSSLSNQPDFNTFSNNPETITGDLTDESQSSILSNSYFVENSYQLNGIPIIDTEPSSIINSFINEGESILPDFEDRSSDTRSKTPDLDDLFLNGESNDIEYHCTNKQSSPLVSLPKNNLESLIADNNQIILPTIIHKTCDTQSEIGSLCSDSSVTPPVLEPQLICTTYEKRSMFNDITEVPPPVLCAYMEDS